MIVPEGFNAAFNRLDSLIGHPGAPCLLEAFFDQEGPFAATTFDALGMNPPEEMTTDDLLAVTLLDVRFLPRAVRTLLTEGRSVLRSHLEAIDPSVDIWEANRGNNQGIFDRALEAWEYLRTLPGVDTVIAGKVLARKRPRLIPIVDSVVTGIIDGPRHQYWELFSQYLGDQSRRDSVEQLRPQTLSDGISTLRVLDVLIWMTGSQSDNARTARRACGYEVTDR